MWILVMVGCLAATSLYGARLWAQQTRGPGAATADAAAKDFLAFMVAPNATHFESINTLVTQKNLDLLGRLGANRLMIELYKEFVASHGKAATVNDKGDGVAVELAPSDAPNPVVCAREADGWHVDLIATYGRWNGLSEQQSLSKISALTATLIPGVPLNPEAANSICQSNLKQINLGLMQYLQDNDERYPPANKWCDALHPYLKDEKLYQCPALEHSKYGYAMNWKLSRKSSAAVETPAQTVGFYESSVLRRNGNGDGKDLAFRHELGNGPGANYAYADGHVMWQKQGALQEFRLEPPATK